MKYVKIIDGSIDAIYDSEMDGTVEAPDYITLEHKLIDDEWVLPPPPPPDPSNYPLSKMQFTKAIYRLGLNFSDISSYIENSSLDADQKADARAELEMSDQYHRNHPLIELVRQSLSPPMTVAELDAKWLEAKEFE